MSISKNREASGIHDFILALLLYLPTLFFMPAAGYVLGIGFFFLFSKAQPLQRRDWLLLLFSAMALVNVALGISKYDPVKHGFMLSVIFIFPCMWIGRSLNRRILKWFLRFTLLECLTVAYEIFIHKTFIFSAQGLNAEDISDPSTNDLMYYFRPFGLSGNSSTMALKIFVAILITFFLFDRVKRPKLTLLVLYGFCLVTFNRTAMMATLLVSCSIYLIYVFSIRKSGRRLLPHVVIWGVFLLLAGQYFGDAVLQLTRGGNSTSGVLTGRGQIWASAISFIAEHPILGNHSMAFRVPYFGKQMHCHNSFLQIAATHGLISLLLVFYVFSGVRLRNLIFVGGILVFSLTQYGVFWNFSYLDLVLYFFLDWDGAYLSRKLINYKDSLGGNRSHLFDEIRGNRLHFIQ